MPTSSANPGSSSDPTLILPASEHVVADGTVAVTGASYTDSFAQSNPGAMYLSISDTSGVLSGYYPAPGSVPSADQAGNGTNTIVFQGSYADVQDIINSLTYAATTASGTDDIHFDIWNQAGVETTGDIPVSIGSTGTAETWTGAISNDWNTAANWSGDTVPAPGDTAIVAGSQAHYPTLSNATLNDETVIVDQEAQPPGNTLDLNGVTLGAGSVLEAQNPSGSSQDIATINLGGTFTVDAGATIVTPGSVLYQALSADAGAVVVNDGTIENTALAFNGGTFVNNGVFANQAVAGETTFINTGTILADNSGASVSGTVLRGTVEIANGGGLTVNGVLSGTAVDFSGAGRLTLTQPMALANGTALNDFGPGDELLITGSAFAPGATLAFTNGTLELAHGGTLTEAIKLNGSYTLGNFAVVGGGGSPNVIAYAPNDGFTGLLEPDIAAPAQEAVGQGGTLSVAGVGIQNNTNFDVTVSITATAGTLSMNGASGSGTDLLTVTGSTAQVNADLASLSYVPGAGASSDVVQVIASIDFPSAIAVAERFVPVTINAGSGPTLTEPPSETVPAGGSVAVSGSYSDSFAAGNPGLMYVEAIATGGSVSATGVSGSPAPGSGTSKIAWSTDYNDVNAVLHSLTYTAGNTAGSGSVYFEVWNQAGVESSDTVPVTITAGGPALLEQASETVSPGGTIAVAGSYSDSFAQHNPGDLFVDISDSSGTLTATNASGQAVAGSGTNSITLSTDYVDVNAILASLHYAAGASAGSDTISFAVWNQAGVDTTGATAVTIDPPGDLPGQDIVAAAASAQTPADFATSGAMPPAIAPSDNGPGNVAMLSDTPHPPIGLPLSLGH